MDAHPRSIIEPYLHQFYSDSFDLAPVIDAEGDDDFPTDFASLSECELVQLSDALFDELDSETPDLRAMERYESICDELSIRQLRSGVA